VTDRRTDRLSDNKCCAGAALCAAEYRRFSEVAYVFSQFMGLFTRNYPSMKNSVQFY